MDWFRLDMATPVPESVKPALKSMAGCIVSTDGRRVFAGINAAWLTVNALHGFGLREKSVLQPEWLGQVSPTQVPRLPEFRETVSGLEGVYPDYMHPWQREILTRFANYRGVHLWWPPGSSKTVGSLAWAMLQPGRILFCTRAGARRTITADIKRFTTASYFVLEGQKPVDIPDVRIVVTGWDTLRFHIDSLRAWGPVTCIGDELHRIKNYRRKIAVPRKRGDGSYEFKQDGTIKNDFVFRNNMTAAAKQVFSLPTVQRRIGATASSIKDRIRDLWAQLDLIEPEMWGHPYDWLKRYAGAKEGEFGGMDTSGRSPQEYIDELNKRLSFVVYQVPYAVTHASLPPKRRQVTYIPKDELLRDEGAEAREILKATDRATATLWMKAHARLAAAASRKKNVLADNVVDSIGENTKIVVITGLRKACEQLHATIEKKLREAYGKHGRPIQTWWGHGDTPLAVRQRIQEEYMAHPGPCVLVGTYQTWGESLNLQDTDLALIGMIPPTPGEVEQLEGRFSRHGQLRNLLIRYLIAEGTYDEHVAQILIDKMPSVEKIIGDEGTALEGFRRAIGGVENEQALIEAVFAKVLASDYEIDEDSR